MNAVEWVVSIAMKVVRTKIAAARSHGGSEIESAAAGANPPRRPVESDKEVLVASCFPVSAARQAERIVA